MFRKTTVAALALIASAAPAFAEGERAISGAVIYLQRMALPQDAQLLVNVSGPHGVAFVSEEISTEGKSVPFAFSFTIPEHVSAEARFAFVSAEGEVLFSSEALRVPAGLGDLALGEILMKQSALQEVVEYLCDGKPLSVRFEGEKAHLVDEAGVERVLVQAVSASGARYIDPAREEETFFWTKGDSARYRLEGADEVECWSQPAATYTASGFEPMWGLTLTDSDYSFLHTPGEEARTGFAIDVPHWSEGRVVWSLAEDLVFEAKPEICIHPATGMPYPERVKLTAGEQVFEGCGGTPLSLLTDAEWHVVTLNGIAVEEGAEATLAFDPSGSVSGQSFCNRFNLGFKLTGESLTFQQGILTEMACADPLMKLEAELMRSFEKVQRFEISPEGELSLLNLDGKSLLTARH